MPVERGPGRVDGIEKAIRALSRRQVLIGIPADGASRAPEPGEKTTLTNAAIGYLMEFGDPETNLPPRPHLVPGVTGAMPKLTAQLRKTAEKALSGDLSEIDKGLHAVGIIGQNAVRAQITDGSFAPLSERTLAARRARGRTGDKPLIDSGQLRRSYTYAIKDKSA